MTPAEKLLIRLPKRFLIIKAEELNLCSIGTKRELAERVAKKQEKESTRIWNAIANPKKN